ncbi:MAG: CHAT domain-containing protein [Rhodospirillaceae bacterium]|nr:CHAT domain-containing protein [Rhodospirillaceae bacterium]MBT5191138.1 CHAT domain-containing protein [Rhodospirillaceae bacterium]MBT5877570.1 CHAT domain-containing protein [Rhodospirillaceae bacterium]MBT6426541.1 CHAT domain-containing protein [Rhodospirillaceae bacterium]MBT6883268.1 CHAT domain-containing protein [Rhodospirillaceae bacterium]
MRDLDAALTDHYYAKHKRGAHKVWRTFAAFTGEIDRFMADLAPVRHANYLEYDYGCWDMCIATLAKRMDANFFRHDDDTAMAPSPRNLLLALQSWQIVTLTGYMDNLYLDPVSVITKGRIQLVAKEDYGRAGVIMSESRLLQAALSFADRCGIVLNVDGHKAFGDSEVYLVDSGSNRGVKLASLYTSRGVVDVDSVRKLPSLPDSYAELQSMARSLGVGDEAPLAGREATETVRKSKTLTDYKVLTFATHGLEAGDLAGLAEPALVLTPPKVGTEQDDGLLTVSGIAQLKLDADWVIRSACNTAAADGPPGADGLSGLAKSFFYAGARSLLVSHWPVASDAAVKITTRMLKASQQPGIGRAEAHRQAMLSLIDDKEKPYYAYPLFWAPFVVVGEGGSVHR